MLRLPAAVLLFTAVSLSADDTTSPKKFVGEWQAKVKDKVVCTIRVNSADPVSGQSESCNINVDANGDLREPASDSQTEETVSPMVNPEVKGSTLRFEENDGGDVLKFEFTLIADGKAELKIVNAPIAVKPIAFTRQ